jgi:hypothetical protein
MAAVQKAAPARQLAGLLPVRFLANSAVIRTTGHDTLRSLFKRWYSGLANDNAKEVTSPSFSLLLNVRD